MRTARTLVALLLAACAGCPADPDPSAKRPRPPGAPDAPSAPAGGGGAGDVGGGGGGGGGGAGGGGAQGPAVGAPAPLPAEALAKVEEPTLRDWTGRALTRPASDFQPTTKAADDLVKYLTEPSGAARWFLTEAADPHRGACGGRCAADAARGEADIDLLRCEYRALGADCTLTEGANLLVVEVRPSDPVTPALLRKLIELVAITEAQHEGSKPRKWKL